MTLNDVQVGFLLFVVFLLGMFFAVALLGVLSVGRADDEADE